MRTWGVATKDLCELGLNLFSPKRTWYNPSVFWTPYLLFCLLDPLSNLISEHSCSLQNHLLVTGRCCFSQFSVVLLVQVSPSLAAACSLACFGCLFCRFCCLFEILLGPCSPSCFNWVFRLLLCLSFACEGGTLSIFFWLRSRLVLFCCWNCLPKAGVSGSEGYFLVYDI